MYVKLKLSISDSSRNIKGFPDFMLGVKVALKLVPRFGVKVHSVFGVDRGGYLIVHDGGDCRCEVSLQSYSASNVELGLRNANFGG